MSTNSADIAKAFAAIKKSKEATVKKPSVFKEFLRFQVGNVYEVRLLPFLTNPERTYFKYRDFYFKSVKTGKSISFVSPITIGQPCPAFELRQKLYKDDPTSYKRLNTGIKYLWNAYVVKDPTNPDNIGKVKIAKFPKSVQLIIEDHLDGKRSEDYGSKVIDPSPSGCNFQIDVRDKGGYQNYDTSAFTLPRELKGVDIDAILAQTVDPSQLLRINTYDEIQKLLDVHFHGSENPEAKPSQEKYNKEKLQEESDAQIDSELSENAVSDSKELSDEDINNISLDDI